MSEHGRDAELKETLDRIEAFNNAEMRKLALRPTHARRGGGRNDFSEDGCRTQADVTYRREMLNNIARGFERGAVLLNVRGWAT